MKPTLLVNQTGGHKHAYHPDELAADLARGWEVVTAARVIADAIDQLSGIPTWIGSSKDGLGSVWVADGYSPRRISSGNATGGELKALNEVIKRKPSRPRKDAK